MPHGRPSPDTTGRGIPVSNASLPGPGVDAACAQALRMLDDGAMQRDILGVLVAAAEAQTGGEGVASILVLDDYGLLRNGASPKLPADYLAAIDRLRPDASVGTCAAAAATGKVVLTPDFQADEKWAELRHLPLALGFVGAWSMPIKDLAGRVLGTFGTYYRHRRAPDEAERADVERLAATAATVIAHCRSNGCADHDAPSSA
jgi:GAF domain-containing protein